jgi:hypothetical protein
MRQCAQCQGFVPPSASVCVHCDTTLSSSSSLLKSPLFQLVTGGTLALTLMACYGRPPPHDHNPGHAPPDQTSGNCALDADHDGVCAEKDCNDDDPTVGMGSPGPNGPDCSNPKKVNEVASPPK